MTCFIVTFAAEAAEKVKIKEQLKTSQGYCPIHDNCWAILSDETAKKITDDLRGVCPGQTTWIFVVRSGTASAWSNSYSEDHSAWLKKNL